MSEELKYKEGELITISSGQYSDYCVDGLFRVAKAFYADEKLLVWAKEVGREVKDYVVQCDWNFEGEGYMEWLNRNNYIADVPYREIHIGDGYHAEVILSEDKK